MFFGIYMVGLWVVWVGFNSMRVEGFIGQFGLGVWGGSCPRLEGVFNGFRKGLLVGLLMGLYYQSCTFT